MHFRILLLYQDIHLQFAKVLDLGESKVLSFSPKLYAAEDVKDVNDLLYFIWRKQWTKYSNSLAGHSWSLHPDHDFDSFC